MSPIHELTELLSKLPGLGPRQARRVVQYLLSKDQQFRNSLATQITSLSQKTSQCSRCYRFDDTAIGLCGICADATRDASTVIVVEHDVDIDAIEASLTYKGYYFVLGGLMNLVKQRKTKILRTEELKKRLKEPELKEVIFALATTPEGDFTARELTNALTASGAKHKITYLGRGLSIGAELEYADPETLRSALKNRS
jgi:recombination protein RecR